MKRIFIAIDLPEQIRERIAAHIAHLRKEFPRLRVGWERTEKLHLTLKFIGDMEEDKVEDLEAAIETVARKIDPFKLLVHKCGIFPSERKPRILWLGADDDSETAARLNELLENECETIGIKRETRDFRPHLTFARIREPHRSQELVEMHLRTEFEPVEFEVAEIVIYESRLQPTGSIYVPVSKHKLSG